MRTLVRCSSARMFAVRLSAVRCVCNKRRRQTATVQRAGREMSGYKVDAKVVLLGKEYGGKTSLVERYLHSRFSGDLPYQNTIGAAYGAKRTEAFGRPVVLGIWDTAGSERYQAMSRIYYRNTWAAVLCYDLSERASWQKVRFWAAELRQHEPRAKIYFAGTKKDRLEYEQAERQVEYHEVVQFSREIDGGPVFETSAKMNENVGELFERIAKDYVKESRDRVDSTGRTDDPVDGRIGLQSTTTTGARGAFKSCVPC